MWAWFNLPDHFGIKKKIVLISTATGTDYSATLDQYNIYSKYMGWEDLGRTLGAGEEEEFRFRFLEVHYESGKKDSIES